MSWQVMANFSGRPASDELNVIAFVPKSLATYSIDVKVHSSVSRNCTL